MKKQYSELYTKLSRLQWLLHRYHMQNHAEHGPMGDPTRGQGRVLAMLKLQPEIPTKDLSYLLGIRQQSLNELLNKLEKGGYVTRVPSEEDRRVMVVKITEKGKGEQQPSTEIPDVFDCLLEEEQAIFGQYLDRVIAALESQVTGDEREETEEWMRAARSRMGNEMFERLMSKRGGFHPHHHGDPRQHGHRWCGGHFSGRNENPGRGRGGHGSDCDGSCPGGWSGPPSGDSEEPEEE